MTYLDDDLAAALLHRLHLAGCRFTFDPTTPHVTGLLSDADIADLRRLRPAVLRLLEAGEVATAAFTSPDTLTPAGEDAGPAEDDR